MSSMRAAVCGGLVSLGISFLVATGAAAGIHTWDVNEVFSNADGSIQYVELWESGGGAGEINVGNGSISSDTQTFSFGQGQVAAPTTNKFYLVATQGFADLPGAPTPDAIISAGKVPFFATGGDTVAFGGFDSWTFGAVPTNGTDALNRSSGTVANSPTNYAGTTGSVDASPPPPCYLGTPGASSCSALAGCGGSACDDADASTHTDVCTEGATTCAGAACYSGAPGGSSCSATAGCGGSLCDDGDAGTSGDVCTEGATTCAGALACYSGTPGVLSCSVAPGCGGTVCDDGDAGTAPDVCVEGLTTCAGTTSVPSLSRPALGVVIVLLLGTALVWALPRWLRTRS